MLSCLYVDKFPTPTPLDYNLYSPVPLSLSTASLRSLNTSTHLQRFFTLLNGLLLVITLVLYIYIYIFFGGGVFFRAAPAAYGGSQARGLNRAVATSLCHSHGQPDSSYWSAAYTTAHASTGSLTHWVMPGIESVSSWMLVRYVSAEPLWELSWSSINECFCFHCHQCCMNII